MDDPAGNLSYNRNGARRSDTGPMSNDKCQIAEPCRDEKAFTALKVKLSTLYKTKLDHSIHQFRLHQLHLFIHLNIYIASLQGNNLLRSATQLVYLRTSIVNQRIH